MKTTTLSLVLASAFFTACGQAPSDVSQGSSADANSAASALDENAFIAAYTCTMTLSKEVQVQFDVIPRGSAWDMGLTVLTGTGIYDYSPDTVPHASSANSGMMAATVNGVTYTAQVTLQAGNLNGWTYSVTAVQDGQTTHYSAASGVPSSGYCQARYVPSSATN